MGRRRHHRRRRHYRGPRPYARIGIFGPRVGCRLFLIAFAAVAGIIVAGLAAIVA